MTGDNGADGDDAPGGSGEDPPTPWHNSTGAVVGASVAGLAAIAIIYALVTFVAGQFGGPEGTPANFVEPTFSATSTSDSATTTTATITSTSPPVTTDINDPGSTSATPSTTDSSETTRTTRSRVRPGNDDDDDDAATTTRKRPRLNETRTLYPRP